MTTEAISNSTFLGELMDNQSVDDLREDCRLACRRVGIVRNSYHHYPPIGAVDFTDQLMIFSDGFPQAWINRYAEERYDRFDPIVKRALNSTKAFWWSDIDESRLTSAEHAYVSDWKSQHLGNGLAVPVFGPNDRNGYVGLGVGVEEKIFDDEDLLRLLTFCNAAHLQYCEITSREREHINLSRREHQTMKYVARGLPVHEVAVAMNLKENTIGTYLRRVYQKLGVDNRVSATLRCLALGYLHV